MINQKRNSYIMKGIFLTICATIILALAMQSCRKEEKEVRLVKVETITVGSDASAPTADFPERVKASEEVNMAFKVSGTLARVYVDEGDKVRQGQIIAELDPTDYRTQLAATEAEYYKIKSEAERVIALYNDSVATAGDYDKARYGLQLISAKYKYNGAESSAFKYIEPIYRKLKEYTDMEIQENIKDYEFYMTFAASILGSLGKYEESNIISNKVIRAQL